MPLVGISEVLTQAEERGYGVPSLLAGNLEMVIGSITAAEEQRSPLILAFNQGVTPQIPMELGVRLMVHAAEEAQVPVATILDHGQTLEAVVKAIHLGSSSVMFDGSSLPYEENVRQTRAVVQVAHAVGVCVEAELGSIAGSAIEAGGAPAAGTGAGNADLESTFTDPERAAEFVKRTGVDALAISFGNVHGVYRGEPRLDLERVRRIRALVDVPLVMHGASGLAESEYAPIIDSGISKICYYTAMGRGAVSSIRKMQPDADEDSVVYHHIISHTIDYFYRATKRLLDVLGCSGAVHGRSQHSDLGQARS